MAKVHYRLASSYHKINRHAESMKHLDTFVDMKGPLAEGQAQPLRWSLVRAIAPPSPGHKSFAYIVRIIGGDSPEAPPTTHTYVETAPASYFLTEAAAKNYLRALVLSHTAELRWMKPWTCWEWGLPATALRHAPAIFYPRGGDDPDIIDFCSPVCVAGGGCDLDAAEGPTTALGRLVQPGRGQRAVN